MLTEPHVIKDMCKLQSIELAKQGIELAKSLLLCWLSWVSSLTYSNSLCCFDSNSFSLSYFHQSSSKIFHIKLHIFIQN
jgi:hypothetical protein